MRLSGNENAPMPRVSRVYAAVESPYDICAACWLQHSQGNARMLRNMTGKAYNCYMRHQAQTKQVPQLPPNGLKQICVLQSNVLCGKIE